MTEEVPEQAELQGEEAQEGVEEVPQEGLEDVGEEPPVGEGYEGTGEEAPLQEEEAAGQEGNVEGAEYAAEADPAQEGLEEAGGPEEGGEYLGEEGQPQDDYAGGEEVQPQEELGEEQVNDPEAENQAETSPFVDSQLARRFNRNPYFGQFCAGLHNLISYDLKIAGTPAQETIQYLNELMAVLATDMWAADDRASVSMPKVDGKRISNPNNPFKSFSHSQSNQESLSMVYST
jgi:hypothetical protein